MKNYKVFATIILGCLAFVSCQKDDAKGKYSNAKGLVILTETHHAGSNKTMVDGTAVLWKDGDLVWLNGHTGTVAVEGSKAKVVESIDFGSDDIYGYYPVSLAPASGAQSDSPTITLPSEYTSSYNGEGRQDIQLPMVAKADAGSSSIMFRHASAAVLVRIRNDFSHPIYIDSVVLGSESYQLSGSRNIDLTADDLGLEANAPSTKAQRRVRVRFARNSVSVAPAEVCEVQVPIFPVGESDITIKVYAHRWIEGMSCDAATYSYSLTNNTVALARNQMLKAQISLSGTNEHLTIVTRGAFSVDATHQVYFSKGNLQYTIADGTWNFAEHQYDVIESANVAENYAGQTQVGLFGWGTNGAFLEGRITAPTSTSTTASDYGPASGNLTQEQDWGHNPIANGGNQDDQWRTLTNAEWNYIIKDREGCSTVGSKSNARFASATVNGKRGVIVFPDTYTHPSVSVESGSFDGAINVSKLDWTKVVINQSNWEKMETAGAIFLPSTGQRVGKAYQNETFGYYHTATYYSSTQSKMVSLINATTINCYVNSDRSNGSAVRLVRNVD